jgi:hypothetical protein
LVLTRRLAHLAIVVSQLPTANDAVAEGEATPMFGIAAIAADTAQVPADDLPLGGVAAELAWWHGNLGVAIEGAGLWNLGSAEGRRLSLGASARLLVLRSLVRSFIEPRDVELGVELQAVAERAWWNVPSTQIDPMAYGFGLAVRLRGGGDPDGSLLLAESRLFVRATSSRWNAPAPIARAMSSVASAAPDRALTVIVGLGASFGAGQPDYARRFRMHPFETTLVW